MHNARIIFLNRFDIQAGPFDTDGHGEYILILNKYQCPLRRVHESWVGWWFVSPILLLHCIPFTFAFYCTLFLYLLYRIIGIPFSLTWGGSVLLLTPLIASRSVSGSCYQSH